jgi:hypothetical protein
VLAVGVSRVRPEQENFLREWFATLQESRRQEVERSFDREGVHHEKVLLIETADGPLMVYAMEMDDEEKAHAVFAASSHQIDVEHRAALNIALDGIPQQRVVFDVRVAREGSVDT